MTARRAITLGLVWLLACQNNNPVPEAPPLGIPATEHHINDKAIANADGTYTITLGNITFTTIVADFSAIPVDTELKMVTDSLVEVYRFSAYMDKFKVLSDSLLAGNFAVNASVSNLAVYQMSNNNMVASYTPATPVAGFDLNGVLMSVEGGSDINFYQIEDNDIVKHFFTINNFRGSSFLSDCFIDGKTAFVYNANEILTFTLDTVDSVNTLNLNIPDFSQVRFAVDERYVYVSIGGLNDGKVMLLDRYYNYQPVRELVFPGRQLKGLAVDANYLYVSDTRSDSVIVLNKTSHINSGGIYIPTVQNIAVLEGYLYATRQDNNTIEKRKLTFKKL